MINHKFSKTLETVQRLLRMQIESEEDLFLAVLEEIKKVVAYNQALVVLLEGDSLIIRTQENINIENYRKFFSEKDKTLTKLIRTRSGILESSDFSLAKELEIDFGDDLLSMVAIPLVIREMTYGFFVLTRKAACFSEDELKMIEAIVSVGSYIIKDAELSNVFKLQLRVLRDNIKDKTRALKVKDEFLANMSHELRTPLNAIIGFSEALSMNIFGELNEKQAEYIGDIHTSGIHLLGMINDLLDLSKIESGKMDLNKEMFNVQRAVEEAVSIVTPLANKKEINLNIDFRHKNIIIEADKRKFHQILYNLISNAIKFTNEKGIVDLSISLKDKDVEISVKDNGIGIAPQFHNKIFEKFQQINNAASGKPDSTGLGLTITKQLIEMHGGSIRVESEEGNGAKFIYTLPLKSSY